MLLLSYLLYGTVTVVMNLIISLFDFVDTVADPEPHHFVGARAATRCGSGFNGSNFKLDVQYR
jgi:hypothetical protein